MTSPLQTKPIIYADDSTLTSILNACNINNNNNNNANCDNINSELNIISDWLKLNKLSLKSMTFHQQHRQVVSSKLKIDEVENRTNKNIYFRGNCNK